jgi:hypothetical protein
MWENASSTGSCAGAIPADCRYIGSMGTTERKPQNVQSADRVANDVFLLDHSRSGGDVRVARRLDRPALANMTHQGILAGDAEPLAVAIYLAHRPIQLSTRHPYRLADFYATATLEGAVDCTD